MIDIIDVASDEQLHQWLPEWLEAPAIALDTEFVRERTYYPIPGLIQLATEAGVYLIDPLAIEDLSPLRQLCEAPVVKVMHSASEDLEVFQRLLGCLPAPLADTQLGAALAGHRFGIGYQHLVAAVLGRELDKGETRSNWLQRPLTASQRHYAAMDVAWLLPVYEQLLAELELLGRVDWWWEDNDRQVLAASRPLALEDSWRRLRGAGRLRPRELAVLQEVCGWRERVARGSDRPRGHVLPDALCLELARQLPTSLAELQAHRELPRRLVKPHGADVLAAIEAGRARPAASWPQLPRPLTSAENRHLKQLRSVVGERAGGLELAPELLARRRDLESLLRRRQLPSSLQGWRQPVVGEPLLDALGGLLEN